jgi:glyoxylase-like metal-dependent hydrolase (beta-lactamase superfamily II)
LSYSRRIEVGEAVLTTFLVGKLRMKTSEIVRPGTELPPGVNLDDVNDLPVYSAHVAIGRDSIVIDPCDYEALLQVDAPWKVPGYTPPPPLLDQMAQAGIGRTKVTHVILTHFHSDHIMGSTLKEANGGYVPAFPSARYYLGAADWNSADVRAALRENPEYANTLGVLDSSKMLNLLERPVEIVPGVMVVPMPGESPGHQIVRVTSKDRVLYCIGDLFHEPMDVADPRIMSEWNDPVANLRSRDLFLVEASVNHALVVAGHMGVGRILRNPTSYGWKEA